MSQKLVEFISEATSLAMRAQSTESVEETCQLLGDAFMRLAAVSIARSKGHPVDDAQMDIAIDHTMTNMRTLLSVLQVEYAELAAMKGS